MAGVCPSAKQTRLSSNTGPPTWVEEEWISGKKGGESALTHRRSVSIRVHATISNGSSSPLHSWPASYFGYSQTAVPGPEHRDRLARSGACKSNESDSISARVSAVPNGLLLLSLRLVPSSLHFSASQRPCLIGSNTRRSVKAHAGPIFTKQQRGVG